MIRLSNEVLIFVDNNGTFMDKHLIWILTLVASFFCSASSYAATQTFWAYGNSDLKINDNAKFLKNPSQYNTSKDIAINYSLGSNWKINSAKLLLKAVDDSFNNTHCSAFSCNDGSGLGEDASEKAEIVNIEGNNGLFSATEIGKYGWYDLGLDVTKYLLADLNSVFQAKVQPSVNRDFYFKNAKLVVDYQVVPIPAAVWLFGSALVGLIGMKRKSA